MPRPAPAPLSLLLLLGCSTPALTPPPAPAAPPAGGLADEVASLEAAHRGGAEHRALVELAGTWTIEVRAPGVERPVGQGRGRLQALHGGRFLRLEVALDLEGSPFALTGHLGFDPQRGEYQALWLSDLAAGMSLLRGGGELDGRGITLRADDAQELGKSVLRRLDPDTFLLETWGVGPDRRERLLRTSTYRRVTR